MMAVVWCDRERRYFIATTGSMEAGMPYVRLRWRQTDPDLQAPAEQMELTVDQPHVCEVYYESCGKIDQHNRHRHDTLKLEHKLRTKWWYSRVWQTILGMIFVDTWLVYSKTTRTTETQAEFYEKLAEEMIDNDYDNRGAARAASMTDTQVAVAGSPYSISSMSVCSARTTPNKTKSKSGKGYKTNQIRCQVCNTKTIEMCKICLDQRGVRGAGVCSPRSGRYCFSTHVMDRHPAYTVTLDDAEMP